jgi:uncharacterized protein with GYD domain
MPTYVIFFHLTHQGLDHLRASGDRVDAAKKTFHQHGAKVKDFYSMMGQYDSMFIVEAPSDDVIAQCALSVGAQGNVRTETHRAFTRTSTRRSSSRFLSASLCAREMLRGFGVAEIGQPLSVVL